MPEVHKVWVGCGRRWTPLMRGTADCRSIKLAVDSGDEQMAMKTRPHERAVDLMLANSFSSYAPSMSTR